MFVSILAVNVVSASDVSVWQGQYYTGTVFNTGTYEFNFTVYDAPVGGDICYSNTTNLTTGNWGEWKTEQSGVNSACSNASEDYFLSIKINGVEQPPRRRLTIFSYLRKDVNEVTAGDLVLHGVLQGLSPLKLQDEINFIKADGIVTSSLYNAPRGTASTLPSVFADSLIHDIIEETNDYGMQECFWDENTETMQMCISGAYLGGRATTVSRSLQVVGNTSNKPVNENFTLCEGNNYVDCETDITGADLLVEDDIESIGSIFSRENITADDTGFFSYLGSLVSRITKLFVQDIDVSGDVNVTGNVNASNFIGDGSLLTNLPAGNSLAAGGDYLYNDSASIYLNETKLNGTIDARATVPNLTNYALKNQSETFAGNITTTQTGLFGWLGSLVSRITKIWVVDINATGNIGTSGNVSAGYFIGNGSLLTNLPAGGLTPVYLESDLNATSAAYTTIFTVALTPDKMNIVHAYLAQSTSTSGVAIRNRVIINESGPVGYCNFVTQTGASAQNIDNILLSMDSADTGVSSIGVDINVPFINIVTCTVIADSDQKNLIIQFDSENVNTVKTHAGSYYTNAVN